MEKYQSKRSVHENDEIEINPIEQNKISWVSQKLILKSTMNQKFYYY